MKKKLYFLSLLIGMSLQAQSIERQVIGSSGTSFSNASVQLDFTVGELVVSTLTDGSTILTQGFHQTNLLVAIKVAPAAFLQGPLLTSGTSIMDDSLRNAGLVPITSPYGDAIVTTSGVLSVTGNDAIVDWVWVALRDEANSSMVIDATSALLQADGDIVGVDGVSPVSFEISAKDYFVSVNHRNHLGIMTANAIALSSSVAVVDFRDNSAPTFGANGQTTFGLQPGDYAMWAGDTVGDNTVKFSGADNDSDSTKDIVLAAPGNIFNDVTYTYNGYFQEDVAMNGSAKFLGSSNDADFIKDNVLAHPGNIFNDVSYIIQEQLP
jgi:hypothetical protein